MEQVIEGNNIEGGTFTLNWTGTATATLGGSSIAKGAQATLTANANVALRFTGGTVGLVQLEAGSVATPFERRPYGQELALCQRYYEVGFLSTLGYNAAGQPIGCPVSWAATKRAVPTMTAVAAFNSNTSTTIASQPATTSCLFSSNITATGGGQFNANWTASAEL
jgi:hypothetical protein